MKSVKFIIKYVIIVLAIFLTAVIVDAAYVGSLFSLLAFGVILLIVNLIVRPILLIIALPLNIITFGLFSFVVNTITIMIADGFVRGVHMGGFLPSLLAAVIISVFQWLLTGTKCKSAR